MERLWDGDDLLSVVIVYLFGMFIAIAVGNGLIFALQTVLTSWPRVIISPLVAGIVEPIFSKFLPAYIVFRHVHRNRRQLRRVIQSKAFTLGAFGGLVVGSVEGFGKVVTDVGLYAGVQTITPNIVLASLLHVLFGGIIGFAVYRSERDDSKFWADAVMATSAVILIHFSWNAYHVLQLL